MKRHILFKTKNPNLALKVCEEFYALYLKVNKRNPRDFEFVLSYVFPTPKECECHVSMRADAMVGQNEMKIFLTVFAQSKLELESVSRANLILT